jgi:hypothetical protein
MKILNITARQTYPVTKEDQMIAYEQNESSLLNYVIVNNVDDNKVRNVEDYLDKSVESLTEILFGYKHPDTVISEVLRKRYKEATLVNKLLLFLNENI